MRRTRRSYLEDSDGEDDKVERSPLSPRTTTTPSSTISNSGLGLSNRRGSSTVRRRASMVAQINRDEECKHWIMVFGFPLANVDESVRLVLERFQQHGNITSYKVPSDTNYMFLRYSTEREAINSISENGKYLIKETEILIGVVSVDSDTATANNLDIDSGINTSNLVNNNSNINNEYDMEARLARAYGYSTTVGAGVSSNNSDNAYTNLTSSLTSLVSGKSANNDVDMNMSGAAVDKDAAMSDIHLVPKRRTNICARIMEFLFG